MKLISLKKITDNMILAKDIGSDMGNILLPKGAQLKHNYAKRLQEWGVHSVYIQDNHMDQVEIDEELSEQTQEDLRQIVADFLKNMAVGQLPEPVTKTIQGTIGKLLTDQKILPYLVEIKEFNENIFRHCVDVCILAVSMGVISGYDSKQLQELAVGAILSDMGKTGLSNHGAGDSGLLPAKERLEFQKHPGLGSDILRKLGSEYEKSALAILQHHEQYDGTGFPNGLKGEQIHEYAKITAIADSYLSSQAPGNEGQRLQPPQALRYIEEHSGTRFDPDLTRIFSQKIAPLIVNKHEDLGSKGHDSSINSVNTNKQYNPGSGKHCPQTDSLNINQQDNSKGDGSYPQITPLNSNKQQIPVDSDRSDAHPDSKHESMDGAGGQPSRDTNQEQRQRMKNELFRIHQSFLSKMNAEPVPEQVIQVIHSIIDELVSDGGIMNDFMATSALNAPDGLNSFNAHNENNAINANNALNDKRIFHCMSVGLLTVMTGVSLGYTAEQLRELGTGAITLEIEKTKLSKDGPGALSTPDLGSVLEYTQSGFERLEQQKSNPNRQTISDFAKIAGLADIYSTLTEQGIGGQPLMPHEVIEYIRDHGGGYFDPQLTRLFLQSIAPFLIGSYVLLNTGEKAKVLKIHKDLLARPVIRVMVDSAGNKLAKPAEKDLEKDLTLFIVKTILEDEL